MSASLRPRPSAAAVSAWVASVMFVCLARCVSAAVPSSVLSLEGAIDVHCHSGPDTVARSLNDLQLVRLAQASGLRGVVLKNHYTMTADRAQLAMQEVAGIEVFGGIVLNRSVGGINAEAVRRMVEMEGRRGKIVWLPTIDAENQVGFARESRPFVAVLREGRPVPELASVFALIAQHDLVLATGHSSADESIVIITAAKRAGVSRILVTHALAESIHATPGKLEKMAAMGAIIELTWLTHSPGSGGAINVGRAVAVADGARLIRSMGPKSFVLSSDLGQQNNPKHPDGLRAFASALMGEGMTAQDIDVMVRQNPAQLLGLPVR